MYYEERAETQGTARTAGQYPQQGGYYPPQQHAGHFPPQYVAPLVQPDVMQARDRAQYVRQQTGHSIVKHLLFGWLLLWIPTIYYTISSNHYWHT